MTDNDNSGSRESSGIANDDRSAASKRSGTAGSSLSRAKRNKKKQSYKNDNLPVDAAIGALLSNIAYGNSKDSYKFPCPTIGRIEELQSHGPSSGNNHQKDYEKRNGKLADIESDHSSDDGTTPCDDDQYDFPNDDQHDYDHMYNDSELNNDDDDYLRNMDDDKNLNLEEDRIKVEAAKMMRKYLVGMSGSKELSPLVTATASGNIEMLNTLVEDGLFCTKPHLNLLFTLAAAHPLETLAVGMYDIIKQAAAACNKAEDVSYLPCFHCGRR